MNSQNRGANNRTEKTPVRNPANSVLEEGDLMPGNISRPEETIILDEEEGLEEGILVEKNGHIELEQEVKEKILQAFKEDPGKGEVKEHTPRIFGSKDETGQIQKKAEAAAVKVIEEEIKAKNEVSPDPEEAPVEVNKIPRPVIERIKKEKSTLAGAEALMISQDGFSIGLQYSPGMIPRIVSLARGKEVPRIINDSFRLEIPVVEVDGWIQKNLEGLEIDQEIPESVYPLAAKALALIYRIKPEARLVRFLKPIKPVSKIKSRSARRLVDKYKDLLKIPVLSIEVSESIYKHREQLKQQLELISAKMVSLLGLIIPPVKIEKSELLRGAQYILKIRDISYDFASLDPDLEPPELFYPLQSRFQFLLANNGFELLGYSETEALLNNIKKEKPSLVKSLFPDNFTVGGLRFVLRGLLREQIPIRDMGTILETIDGHIQETGDPELLIEYIRSRFSQYISNVYKDEKGDLNVLILSPGADRAILESIRESNSVRWLDMDYNLGFRLLSKLAEELKAAEQVGIQPAILTSPLIRRFVRKIIEASLPNIPVLSYSEIAPLTPIKALGTITLDET